MKTKYIIGLSAALSIVAISSVASAETISLHASGGAGVVLNPPFSSDFSSNKFDMGYQEEVKALVKIVPNLSFGPVISSTYFPQHNATNGEANIMWDFGGALRLQGNRDAGWSPYIEGQTGGSVSTNIWNPFVRAVVGADFAIEPTHTFFVGPFVAWDHVVDTWRNSGNQTALLSNNAVNTATAGISISFDAPVKPRVVVQTNTVVETKTVETPVVQKEVVVQIVHDNIDPTSTQFAITQLSFAKDSSSLNDEAMKALDEVATALNQNTQYSLTIEGKASSEGTFAHNLMLSHQRAQGVVDYLADHGKVNRLRLLAVSAGAIGEPNDASNRSVDFIVLTLVKK